jgi:hypothetical protein
VTDSPEDADAGDVAERLYGLPPEEFTAARDAAAKQASGEVRKAVKALRKPSVSAWLVNRLLRDQPELVDQLLELGAALAEAQAQRSGVDLRALGQQRRELVQAVTQAATSTAGRDVTPVVRSEVEQTLEAALADPAAADAVRTGALVRPLSFAGFGGVDVTDAVGVPSTRRPAAPRAAPVEQPVKASKASRRTAAAEAAALEAGGRLDDAVQACEAAERGRRQQEARLEEATASRDQVQRRVDALERELEVARAELETQGHRLHDVRSDADQATRRAERAQDRVRQAQEQADAARAALDALRRGTA